jgi:hypothetical protein
MRKKHLQGGVLEEVYLPHNQAYYDRIHDKIMARIEDTEMEAPLRPTKRSFEKSKRLLRDHWKGWLESREI